MIKIDTLELVDDLIWENEFVSNVRSIVEDADGGGKMIFEDAGNINKSFDLVGGEDVWLSRAQIVSLYALINSAGASYTLDYNGDTSTVRFRNEDQPPIEAVPIKEKPKDQYYDTDYFNNIRIKLMEL